MFYGNTQMRNCATIYPSLRSLLPKCTSKAGHQQTNILLFQCKIGQFKGRPTYVLLLLVTQICHKSTVLQHSIFLYSWEWHVAQQHSMYCRASTATV